MTQHQRDLWEAWLAREQARAVQRALDREAVEDLLEEMEIPLNQQDPR